MALGETAIHTSLQYHVVSLRSLLPSRLSSFSVDFVSSLRISCLSLYLFAIVILLDSELLRYYRFLPHSDRVHFMFIFWYTLSLKQTVFRSELSFRMANLPENAIQLIFEMAAEEPITWEDAFVEGSLRIVRFLDWEGQRVLATLDRTARCSLRFATLVAWEQAHPLHAFYWS